MDGLSLWTALSNTGQISFALLPSWSLWWLNYQDRSYTKGPALHEEPIPSDHRIWGVACVLMGWKNTYGAFRPQLVPYIICREDVASSFGIPEHRDLGITDYFRPLYMPLFSKIGRKTPSFLAMQSYSMQ
jgi:hypothetical protein